MPRVRRLLPADRAAWDELWAGYLEFYEEEIAPEVSDATFARLTERDGPLLGLVAEDGDRLVGLAHLVFHPSTWATEGYCYLEDLFVDPAARRGGVATALVAGAEAETAVRGAEKLYWQTQAGNREARALYERIARNTGYLVYERPGAGERRRAS